MARGHPARHGPGGGDGIQAARRSRTRLTVGTAALASAGGLALYPALDADGVERLVGMGGAFSLVALLAAVAGGASGAVPWAVAALGGEYAAWIAIRGGGVDTRSPLYGAGLLLVAELAYWAIDRRSIARVEAELETRRAAVLLVLLAASIGVGAVLLAASSLSIGGGAVVEAVGVAAAVALLVIVASLARSQSEQEHEA